MSPPPVVLVARPALEAEETVSRLDALGYRGVAAPTLAIERRARVSSADLAGAQALVLTSPSGARAALDDLGPGGAGGRAVFAVGDKTAALAEALSPGAVISADGDATTLAPLLRALPREAGALLFLQAETVSTDLAAALAAEGFATRARTLYAAVPASALPEAAEAALAEGAVVAALLFSAKAAASFARLARGADLSRVAAVCLSARIAAEPALEAFRVVVSAPHPRLDAALTLLLTAAPPQNRPQVNNS